MFIVGMGNFDNTVVNSAQVTYIRLVRTNVNVELVTGTQLVIAHYDDEYQAKIAYNDLIDALRDNAVMFYYMPSVREIWQVIMDAEKQAREEN